MKKISIRYLYNMAYRDIMTGLKNRNAFEETMKLLRKKINMPENLSAVLMDIDCMKRINDLYGHYTGDEVIKTVGRCILKSFDDSRLCFRTGGDEFLCFTYCSIDEKINKFNKILDKEISEF